MIRILIVDDHLLFQQNLGRLINAQPDMAVVGGAVTVQEAIREASRLSPDIVLMDYRLPDGTGIDATLAILEDMPAVRIVFLTIHEKTEAIVEAIRVGASGYLPKHIPAEELLQYIRELVRGQFAIQPHFASWIIKKFALIPKKSDQAAMPDVTLTLQDLNNLRESWAGPAD